MTRCVPRHGSVAGRIRPDERRVHAAAHLVARHHSAGVAGDRGFVSDPVRARAWNPSRCRRCSACRSVSKSITSSIYHAIHGYPSDIGLASTYAVALLVITSLCVCPDNLRLIGRHGSALCHRTGKGFPPAGACDLGRWRYVTPAAFLIFIALLARFCRFSCCCGRRSSRFYSVPSLDALKHLSLDSYRHCSQPIRRSAPRSGTVFFWRLAAPR